MTRFAASQGFMGPFSADGRASIAPTPPWHYAADFVTVECWADPSAIEALLPPGLSLHPDELRIIQSASDAPASFIRDAALRAAKRAAKKG